MLWFIAEWALRSAALIVVVWLVLKILRIRNPRLECSAWLAVLFASMAMPLLTALPAWPAMPSPDLAWLQQLNAVGASTENSGVDWQAVLSWFSIAVAAALLGRQTSGVVRWWIIQRTATPLATPQFTASDVRATRYVNSPATVFSTILVPVDFEAWTPQMQRVVIAHERAHVKNGDFYVRWLAQVHRSLFWFNPLAWWLAERLSILSEHISDDAALEEASGPAYAEMLLSLAQRIVRDQQEAVSMVNSRMLAVRVDRILSGKKPACINRARTVLTIGALLPVIGGVAGFQMVLARPSEPAHGRDFNTLTSSGRIVRPRSNPENPLSPPDYPPASRRSEEQGVVVLNLHVLEDGGVADAVVLESSGYPDLDYAALYKSFHWRLDPGTINGVPARMWGRFAVSFQLTQDSDRQEAAEQESNIGAEYRSPATM